MARLFNLFRLIKKHGMQENLYLKGRLNCNEFSIGIELEGCEEDDFTQNQYKNLVNICLTLFKYYPEITRQNVVGHSEIAPGRKTDPGKNFNWEYLRENL